MYELGYCSLLLLLCERKLMTFSNDDIRYEYDVFSRGKEILVMNNKGQRVGKNAWAFCVDKNALAFFNALGVR